MCFYLNNMGNQSTTRYMATGNPCQGESHCHVYRWRSKEESHWRRSCEKKKFFDKDPNLLLKCELGQDILGWAKGATPTINIGKVRQMHRFVQRLKIFSG